jgi:hypothetical protein
MANQRDLPHVGWREWLALPILGVQRIKAKIDTGARTSALHAFGIEVEQRGMQEWVRFAIHPFQRDDSYAIQVEYPVAEYRIVRSSNGVESRRPVIVTDICLGRFRWTTELTLADRDAMGFRMLLGRSAVRGLFLVDPGRSFLKARKGSRHSQ